MAHPTLAPAVAWEASFKQHLSDLLRVYAEGLGDERLAELLLAEFSEHASSALVAAGVYPTPHAVRALADRLLAAGVS